MSNLTREEVLAFYNLMPFEHHPLWKMVLAGELTSEQVLAAEEQHFIRSNVGRHFRRRAAEEARSVSDLAYKLLSETYSEECLDDDTGPSHVELIKRLLLIGGLSEERLAGAIPTAGNAAAIALYKDIGERGPLHHMIGAGAVEYYYSQLSPKILGAYKAYYGMSDYQAETYAIHGPMDREHAERALAVLDEQAVSEQADSIRIAVRDAFFATSLHYDGMLQAALGRTTYWSGQ